MLLCRKCYNFMQDDDFTTECHLHNKIQGLPRRPHEVNKICWLFAIAAYCICERAARVVFRIENEKGPFIIVN